MTVPWSKPTETANKAENAPSTGSKVWPFWTRHLINHPWRMLGLGAVLGFGLALAYGSAIVVIPVQGQGVYVINKITGNSEFCVGPKCTSAVRK